MTAIELFVLLQVLDFMTTLVGLRMGGTEMSPFVSWLMEFDQVWGLITVKMLGFLMAGYCIWRGRLRIIEKANWIFAVIVIWNTANILRAVTVFS